MDALVSVRQTMKEMQQRESNAYEQVKQAVQMTEEANLEKTKVKSSKRLELLSIQNSCKYGLVCKLIRECEHKTFITEVVSSNCEYF